MNRKPLRPVMYATGSRSRRRRTKSMNTRAAGPATSRRESEISSARETPSAVASNTSASRRGCSQPAAVSGIIAESIASRTGVPDRAH